ncbi:MAG: xanthine dehydrogenase molybdopterin binding subunit [Defluviicoccus sp.]|nr:xanthine dehydrogenase molybdopterin binding subunit [Defluviicoccus sp.]
MSASALKGGVHRAWRHDSAEQHVTGRAIYIDDMPSLPGTQEIWLATSPHPHARILSIDCAKARAVPGVSAVIAATDIPGVNDVAPIFSGEPILADGVAEYVGHPIAAIAASDRDTARRAAALVAVAYEVLEPVLSIEDALARESYVARPQIMQRGDAAAAIAAAPHRIEGEAGCGGQDHFYLEGQVALAVPANAVTVEVRRMGGAFGGKESQATIVAAIAAVAARATGLPAKLRLARDEDMIVTGKRHDFLFRYEAGFDERGRIAGLDFLFAARAGNVADLSTSVMGRALCHADNCYDIPNALFRGYCCKTNTVSNTAFRGFGGPQGMVAIELVIEHIARTLGMDVEAVRRANYYGAAPRNVTPYGQTVDDNIIEEVVDRLSGKADYEARRREVAAFNATSPVIKKGIAMVPIKFGISFNVKSLNQAGALVHVYTDGSVHLNHGGTEMGQGLYVKIAQVVSEAFQIDLDRIRVSPASTDKVPNTSATAASSGSDLNGMAALDAANRIKQRMAGVAAEQFGVAPAEIRFADNRVYAGNRSLAFDELAKMSWAERVSLSATGFYRTPDIHWDAARMQGRPFFYYAYGACIAEVAIDTLTGENRVLRADMIEDCGASLNPAIDLGQIEGGFVQGMGWVTMEELWWDAEGRLRTHGPSTYKIPGSRDVPPVFNVHILEDSPNPHPTIFRSKAVGEPPLMLALSVWLAIRDAVSSLAGGRYVRLDPPATPERVLAAVEAARAP